LSETGIPDLTAALHDYLAMDQKIALGVDIVGGQAVFIAYNDPPRVFREIAFKWALIADLLAEEHRTVGCAAITKDPYLREHRLPTACNCGRDENVARRLRLLAAIYEEETP
jgi:hypothetical protein